MLTQEQRFAAMQGRWRKAKDKVDAFRFSLRMKYGEHYSAPRSQIGQVPSRMQVETLRKDSNGPNDNPSKPPRNRAEARAGGSRHNYLSPIIPPLESEPMTVGEEAYKKYREQTQPIWREIQNRAEAEFTARTSEHWQRYLVECGHDAAHAVAV